MAYRLPWYNTSQASDLVLDVNHQPMAATGASALQHDGAYGGYINFLQQVSGVAGGQGTTLFLNISQADRRSAATDGQVALGMEYQGAFGRPHDMIGAALGATHANGRQADYQRLYNSVHPNLQAVVNDGNETVAEVFYNWQAIPSVSFRPNVQYVLHPGGSDQRGNAFVLGLKTTIAF